MKGMKKSPNLYHETFGEVKDTDQEHGKRLDRYSKAKEHQRVVAEFIKDDGELIKEYDALVDCGEYLVFRHFYRVSQYRLINGCSCKKHLLCCLCALRRAARQAKEYETKIRQLLDENPEWVPVLITRTIRNGPDLGERYSHFISAHKKMMQYRRNSLKSKTIRLKKLSVMRYVMGAAGSYEFKLGEFSKEWHPHSHEIALLDGSVDFTEIHRNGKDHMIPLDFEINLSEEWRKATGDSWVVDVRMLNRDDEESFRKGCCEAFKYALKFTSLEVGDQVHAYKTLRGRRLIYSYGCLWGVKISDSSVDTVEESLKLEPYVDLMYRYFSGRYNLTEVTDFGKLEERKTGRRSRKNPLFEIHFTDGSVINQATVDKFLDDKVPF